MKNIALVLLTSFFLTSSGLSQLQVGAKAGLNFANWTYSGELLSGTKWSARTGPVAGALLAFGFSNSIQAQMEVHFIQKGLDAVTPFGNVNTSMNYVELPLLAKFTLQLATIKPYALGGVSVGYLLNSRSEGTDFTGAHFNRHDTGQYRREDYSLQVGIGATYPISQSSSLFCDGRYSRELNHIEQFPGGTTRTTGFQIQIGFLTDVT